MKRMNKMVMLMAAVTLYLSSYLNAFAMSDASAKLNEISSEGDYVTTLSDGTSSYTAAVRTDINEITETFFNEWVKGNDNISDVALKNIVVVPVTGNLAYSEMNSAYQTDLNLVKKEYSKKPNVTTYAVRYTYVCTRNGAESSESAMGFMGKSDDGETAYSTAISNFNPKSDTYITAMYTILYPTVPAMIFDYE